MSAIWVREILSTYLNSFRCLIDRTRDSIDSIRGHVDYMRGHVDSIRSHIDTIQSLLPPDAAHCLQCGHFSATYK